MKNILAVLLAFAIICIGMLLVKLDNVTDNFNLEHDKVLFYEKVIEDFGIGEFINYPELYYDEEYREQALVHNCMWAIDDAIDWTNKYYECERELNGN